MLNQTREEELIKLCRDMIKTESISGNEKKMADLVKENMCANGFDEVIIDKYGSVIGHIAGEKSGKKILFDAHIDTVGVDRSEWNYDPFGAEIEDGKIYGRGSSDMKGSLAAMIQAANDFKEDTNKNFKGDIYISAPVHEECFEGVAAREISKKTKPDYVIIGEPSSLNIMRGQRGRAEIVLETKGESAHSASPEVGKNAVYSMVNLIKKIRNINLKEHSILGKGILELTDIISSPYPGSSIVPNHCRATFDRRTLVGESRDSILEQIQEIIEEAKKEDNELQAEVYYSEGFEDCWTGNKIRAERFFPAWLYEENNEFIQRIYSTVNNTEITSEISHYSFCTNGSHYAGEKDIPTLGFGPSDAHLAHVKDEYIEIEQLKKGYVGYYKIIEELLV